VTAFAAAAVTLSADPNLGAAADYRRGGIGPATSLRVVRSSPDRVASAFDTPLLQATDVLTVPVASIPDPQAGDTFEVESDLLTVQHAERDAAGAAWRVLCRR
jgi:hypothetical protein